MRRNFYLEGSKGGEVPRYLCAVDTEAKREPFEGGERQTLLFGYFRLIEVRGLDLEARTIDEGVFYEAMAFWRGLIASMPKKSRVIVFANNWQYDAMLLQVHALSSVLGWRCVRFGVDTGRFIIDYRICDITICLRDVYQYWGTSVGELGDALGIAKLEMPDPSAPWDAWIAYCARDVDIILRAMLAYLRFIVEHNLGNFQRTTPAQAFEAFTHRFMRHRILIHDRARWLEAERRAYHGGRSECFRIGRYEGDFYRLDVNSLYPFVMHGNRFPIVPVESLREPSLAELERLCEKWCVIVECLVDTNEACYPIVINKRLCFPVGQFEATLTTPEVRYALERGHIVRAFRAYLYDGAEVFSDYVSYFYTLRLRYKKEGNRVYARMCKLFLNALYGKFGEKPARWDLLENPDIVEMPEFQRVYYLDDDNKLHTYMRIGGSVFEMREEGETSRSFPAIAAHVTAYGRMRLWGLMLKAGLEHVYYVDTDSLFVDREGFERLSDVIDDDRLGYLKVEARASEFEIYTVKDYRFGEERKAKGVRKGALVEGDTVKQVQFRRWLPLVRKGVYDAIIVENKEKRISHNYLKGNVLPDGRVTPFVLTL